VPAGDEEADDREHRGDSYHKRPRPPRRSRWPLPPCQRLPGLPPGGRHDGGPHWGKRRRTRAPACPPPLGPAVASHRAPGEVPSRGAAPTGADSPGAPATGGRSRTWTMAKQLCFDSDARDALKSGVTKLMCRRQEHPRPPRPQRRARQGLRPARTVTKDGVHAWPRRSSFAARSRTWAPSS
jgi:hypothetical protein